jgi:hypothetical protein
MPLPAQRLASIFGSHARPEAALSIPLHSALAMVFHITFLCNFSIYNTRIPVVNTMFSFYVVLLNNPMTSFGVFKSTLAPFSFSSPAVRNPQSAPAGNIPAATAVRISVSVSPR